MRLQSVEIPVAESRIMSRPSHRAVISAAESSRADRNFAKRSFHYQDRGKRIDHLAERSNVEVFSKLANLYSKRDLYRQYPEGIQ